MSLMTGRGSRTATRALALARETIPVIEFMAERYPSPAAEQLLVEGYVLAEDYPAAIEVLARFVEQYPNAAPARARLEALRNR